MMSQVKASKFWFTNKKQEPQKRHSTQEPGAAEEVVISENGNIRVGTIIAKIKKGE